MIDICNEIFDFLIFCKKIIVFYQNEVNDNIRVCKFNNWCILKYLLLVYYFVIVGYFRWF